MEMCACSPSIKNRERVLLKRAVSRHTPERMVDWVHLFQQKVLVGPPYPSIFSVSFLLPSRSPKGSTGRCNARLAYSPSRRSKFNETITDDRIGRCSSPPRGIRFPTASSWTQTDGPDRFRPAKSATRRFHATMLVLSPLSQRYRLYSRFELNLSAVCPSIIRDLVSHSNAFEPAAVLARRTVTISDRWKNDCCTRNSVNSDDYSRLLMRVRL